MNDRKKIEKEEQLNLALTAGNIGCWDLRPDTGYLNLSQTLLDQWEIKQLTFDYTLDGWLNLIDPVDRDRVRKYFKETTPEKPIFDVEFRVCKPSAELIWIHAKGRLFLNKKGEPEKLTGITLDITERKNDEYRLKKLNFLLESKIIDRTKELEVTYKFADLILENIPNMIFVKDANDLKFLRFNKAGENLLGLCRENLIGKNDFDFFPEEQARFFQDKDRQVLAQNQVVDIPEEEIKTIGNKTKVLHTKKIPIFDENGIAKYLIGISEDITEKKQVEAERLQSMESKIEKLESIKTTERLSFLSNASSKLGSSLELETILKNLTKESVPILGDWCSVKLVQSDGKLKQLAVAHQDPLKVKRVWEINEKYPTSNYSEIGPGHVLRTGQSELIEYISEEFLQKLTVDEKHLKILKEMNPFSYICAPIKVRNEVIGVFSVVTTEDSKRHYTQADLKLVEELCTRAGIAVDNARLFLEAKNLNKIKDEFLATLSHELRTPINVIQGHADILMADYKELSAEEVYNSISTIQRNTRLQTQIVSDLLDVSSIVTGKISYNPHEVSPTDVVNAVLSAIQPVAAAKSIKIVADVSKAPLTMLVDSTRLHQILWNLINNAVKFTSPGGEVLFHVEQKNADCEFIVKDTGIGINSEFLPFVFDRFRQADSSTSRKYGGLGLGLSIVKNLAELHGGSVQAESAGVGSGSSFTVTLPIKTLVSFNAPTLSEVLPELTVSAKKTDKPLKGIKILLVEDSQDNRELIKLYLSKYGAETTAVESPGEARKILESLTPNIILSDIGMPDENGLEFIKKLRCHKKWENIPAVALTAYVRPEEITEALEAGFQAHISKPISPDSLVAEILNILQTH